MKSDFKGDELKSKDSKLLQILRGVSKKNNTQLQDTQLYDTKNAVFDKIRSFTVHAKCVLIADENLKIKTEGNILVYSYNQRILNIILDGKMLSCNLTEDMFDFYIFKASESFVIIQYEKYFKIFKISSQGLGLEEIQCLNFVIVDYIQFGRKFYFIVSNKGRFQMHDFIYTSGRFEQGFINNLLDLGLLEPGKKILFAFQDNILACTDDRLIDHRTNMTVFLCSEVYEFGEKIINVSKTKNFTRVALLHNKGQTDAIDFNSCLSIKIIDDILILYDCHKSFFYQIKGFKLKYLCEVKHFVQDGIVTGVGYLCKDKEISCIQFIKNKQKEKCMLSKEDLNKKIEAFCSEKSKSLKRSQSDTGVLYSEKHILNNNLYDPTKENSSMFNFSADNIFTNLNPLKKEYLFSMDGNLQNRTDKQGIEDNAIEMLSSSNESPSDVGRLICDLSKKIESLSLKIDEDRKRTEVEGHLKFKKLLENVSMHLNDKLVSTMERTIRDEIKGIDNQVRRFLTDCLSNAEKMNNASVNKVIQKIENNTSAFKLDSSKIISGYKEVILENIVPIVECCFTEMKLQMLNEINLSKPRFEGVEKQTISIREEIINLISQENLNDAALLAMDCTEDVFRGFLENVMDSNLEHFSPSVQVNLLRKCLSYLEQNTQDELIINFMSELIISLEFHDLEYCELNELHGMLKDLKQCESFATKTTKLMLALQEKQVSRLLKNKVIK